jgi:hypothetical protein
VIRNLSLFEFLGRFFFLIIFSLVVLVSWVGCFLLDIILGSSLFTYSRIFISGYCSVLAFSFFLKMKKIYILHFWHLIFWVISLILVHVWKDFILFEIVELN